MIFTTNVNNRQQLIKVLLEEANSYTVFILERMNRDPKTLNNTQTQKHHIIPLYCKGPNCKWNLIILTIEEHGMAHQLLYDNYHNLEDLGASQMLRGQLQMGFNAIRQLARATMQSKNVSFYNSNVQRELGQRPKKQRQPYARNSYIITALSNGFDLEYMETGEVVKIGPHEFSSLVAVIDKLMLHPQMKHKRQNWDLCEKKEKHYSITALTRTLTGHLDKQTGKGVYTFMGWRVLGINVINLF